MMTSIIISAALGGIGAVIGHVTTSNRLVACILAAVFGALGANFITPHLAPKSRLEVFMRKAIDIDALEKDPRLASRLKGASFTEGYKIGAQLSYNGLKRLPAALLLERSALIHKVLSLADTKVCADFAMGRESEGMQRAIESLSDEDLTRWTAIAGESMKAELDQKQPEVVLHEGSVQTAWEDFFAGDSDADRLRFQSRMEAASRGNITDDEACELAKKLHGKIPQLKNGAGETLAASLVSDQIN